MADCRRRGYRLGLKPWEVDRCQPVDLAEMLDGWKWRYSRSIELMATAAQQIGNRIPLNQEPVNFQELCRSFRFYSDN